MQLLQKAKIKIIYFQHIMMDDYTICFISLLPIAHTTYPVPLPFRYTMYDSQDDPSVNLV